MENQDSELLPQTQVGKIPEKWQEKFLIKRIDEEDIEITLEERDAILKFLAGGQRFIQVGKYTLMLNALKSIDPIWGGNNNPPKPKPIEETNIIDNLAHVKVLNQDEIDLWESLFGKGDK